VISVRAAQPTSAAARRSFFAEHGWLVIRGGVDAARLTAARRVYDELMAPCLRAHATPARSASLWQLAGAERARPVVVDLLQRSGAAEIAAQLLGGDDVRLLQDTFLLKRRGGGGRIALHQDYSYTGYFESPRTLGVRFPLETETRRSGCMWVVDGSHRWGLLGDIHALSGGLRDVRGLLTADQAAQIDARRVLLELAPGDVSLHHCLTLHGSDESRTETPRRTIVTHLVAGGCRVVRERLPSAEAFRHFQTDATGRLAGERFPILHRRGRRQTLRGTATLDPLARARSTGSRSRSSRGLARDRS
jgi:ectoine hydroxylase-related dioxygenase (phytanoyl-CoA dioxygenase family)